MLIVDSELEKDRDNSSTLEGGQQGEGSRASINVRGQFSLKA